MKNLGQQYVQMFNRTRKRTGTLWEGRFRSSVVDSDAYLFRCQQYIELNPVRAGMVARPEAYPWSELSRKRPGRRVGDADYRPASAHTCRCPRPMKPGAPHIGACLGTFPGKRSNRYGTLSTLGCLLAAANSWTRFVGLPESRGWSIAEGHGNHKHPQSFAMRSSRRKKGSDPYLSSCSIAARSSVSSFWVAAILDLAKSLWERPWTRVYLPPAQVTG